MNNFNFKEGQYLEFQKPHEYEYISVRIHKVDETGVNVVILSDSSEKKLSYYFLENNSFRYPFISEKLIENCGFNFNSEKYFEKNEIIIIECIAYNIKENNFDNFIDYSSKSLGFKVLRKNKKQDFVKILNNLPYETDPVEFKNKHDTISTVEDLFAKLKEFDINDIDFDIVILKSKE